MRKVVKYLLILLLSFNAEAQHYSLFSQYMYNGLAINPAYTGSREALSVTALHRSQWTGLEGAPKTQTLSLHAPLKKQKIAIGAMLYNDKIGVTRNTGIITTYAYRLQVQEQGTLSFGLSAGLKIWKSNWSQVSTITDSDPSFLQDTPNFLAPNFGTGIYYYHPSWYVGLGIPFLLSQTHEIENNTFKTYHDFGNYNYLITSGGIIPIDEGIAFEPSVLIKYHSGVPVQVDINAIMQLKNKFWGGISIRTNDALVGLLKYQINNQFSCGYSYDYTLSPLQNFNNGSHEIMLRYEFGYKMNVQSPRFL